MSLAIFDTKNTYPKSETIITQLYDITPGGNSIFLKNDTINHTIASNNYINSLNDGNDIQSILELSDTSKLLHKLTFFVGTRYNLSYSLSLSSGLINLFTYI